MPKFTCDLDLGGCGKLFKEDRSLHGFRGEKSGDKEVITEWYDLCPKCMKRQLQNRKNMLRFASALEKEVVTVEEVKIRGKVFWEKLGAFERQQVQKRRARRMKNLRKKSSPSGLRRIARREEMFKNRDRVEIT